MTTEPRQVFRVGQLFDVYGINRNAAFKLIASGELKSFRVGRARLITRDAIEDFIRRQEAGN